MTKLFIRLPSMTESVFLKVMNKYNIDVTIIKDEQGKILVLNLVDHKARIAVSTADLGINAHELNQHIKIDQSKIQESQLSANQEQHLSGRTSNITTLIPLDLLQVLLANQNGGGGPSHGKRAKKRRNKP